MSDTVLEIRKVLTELVIGEGVQKTAVQIERPQVELLTIGIQGPSGPPGATGPQGIQGPQGISGDAHYVHTQSVASAVWTITHSLGKYPSATVVDSADSEVIGDMEYISPNTITITFSGAFGGKAYLN